MGEFRRIFGLWKKMFSSPRYIVILVVSGFIFYLLNGLVLNLLNIGSFYDAIGLFGTIKILFVGSLSFIYQVTLFAAVSTIILSLLVGMMVSLLSYRFDMRMKTGVRGGIFSSIGLFLGMAAPGCAACGVGLLSVLGLTSALAILPFNGHEVMVLAIGVMVISIIGVSKKFYKGCDIGKNMNTQRESVERGQVINERGN